MRLRQADQERLAGPRWAEHCGVFDPDEHAARWTTGAGAPAMPAHEHRDTLRAAFGQLEKIERRRPQARPSGKPRRIGFDQRFNQQRRRLVAGEFARMRHHVTSPPFTPSTWPVM